MGLLVAIFVTLVVVGSVMWIKPSKRDLRITRIRREAMSRGIKVRLLDEKLRSSLFPWLDDYRGYVLYENHQLGAPKDRVLRVLRVCDPQNMHELDRLARDGLDRALDQYAKRLADIVLAVVLYPTGIGILWDEQGDEQDVEELDLLMRELNSELSEVS